MSDRHSHRPEKKLTRREFHGLGAAAVVAAATPWLAREARAEEPQLATDIPENQALLSGIGFKSQSEKEGQQCKNCMLYTAAESGGVGKCQLVQKGVVPETGWCLSWVAKPA